MKAYVFSIGEKTTDLCVDLMKQYGYDVVLFQDNTSLYDKLKRFYTEALATTDQEFIRIDADIIPNSNVKDLGNKTNELWVCANGFDWYKQDRGAISIHKMHRSIIELCLEYIDEAKGMSRPETYVWRKPAINRNTTVDNSHNFGIHGYGQADNRERIKQLKDERSQTYDWDLVERIEAL